MREERSFVSFSLTCKKRGRGNIRKLLFMTGRGGGSEVGETPPSRRGKLRVIVPVSVTMAGAGEKG